MGDCSRLRVVGVTQKYRSNVVSDFRRVGVIALADTAAAAATADVKLLVCSLFCEWHDDILRCELRSDDFILRIRGDKMPLVVSDCVVIVV